MDAARLARLLDRAAAGDRAAADELFGAGIAAAAAAARTAGDELGFRFACAELAHLLDRAGELAGDTARERYSALVDDHGGDPTRLAILRPIGERLRRLEDDGVLPRSMVVRSRRRRD
jgi:hypothetical protein